MNELDQLAEMNNHEMQLFLSFILGVVERGLKRDDSVSRVIVEHFESELESLRDSIEQK